MKEKADVEFIAENEAEPNLHGMPETLSLLKNFRTKLKEDEIRRRELKKKIFESESTQTVGQNTDFGTQTAAQNFAQISRKMLLKLIFILMCSLSFVTIFVWHLSAYVNSRKNDDLSDFVIKEKINELKVLKEQMQACQNHNDFLLGEIHMIEKQFDDTIQVFDSATTKSTNRFYQIAISAGNALITLVIVVQLMKAFDRKCQSFVEFIICMLYWCSLAISLHYVNSTVEISPILSCVPILVFTGFIFFLYLLNPRT